MIISILALQRMLVLWQDQRTDFSWFGAGGLPGSVGFVILVLASISTAPPVFELIGLVGAASEEGRAGR